MSESAKPQTPDLKFQQKKSKSETEKKASPKTGSQAHSTLRKSKRLLQK
jgi:hypothetical protein|tara:strand:+ start:339 stop:485 length:147 start_codon:yes stop_codon:yes gene_type:complete